MSDNQLILDTPERKIYIDDENRFATIVDVYASDYDGSTVTSTSYFSIGSVAFLEEHDMIFEISFVPNIEVLHHILKHMGIENYTWLRYGYHPLRPDRITLTFTDDADYSFFKLRFYNQIKNNL